jgi:sulfatase modifying factor 1
MDFLNRFRVTSEGWQQSQRRPLAFVAGVALVAVATARVSLSQPATPQRGQVIENSLGMKLVVIPAGEFEMGGETVAQLEGAGISVPDIVKPVINGEQPVHRVQITSDFLMGQTEVTLGQFLRFYHDSYKGKLDCETDGKGCLGYDTATGEIGYKRRFRPWSWGHPDMDLKTEAGRANAFRNPVVNVSWNDAVAFCNWLSAKEGKRYRLPTEAEWEYACRAGTTTRYWTGDDPESLAVSENVSDGTLVATFATAKDRSISSSDRHVFTAPAGSYENGNPFGLFDMQGNVAEWCGDWYDEKYYEKSPTADPQGPESGSLRVVRGGSWDYYPVYCRSSNRDSVAPTNRAASVGFRVVATIE